MPPPSAKWLVFPVRVRDASTAFRDPDWVHLHADRIAGNLCVKNTFGELEYDAVSSGGDSEGSPYRYVYHPFPVVCWWYSLTDNDENEFKDVLLERLDPHGTGILWVIYDVIAEDVLAVTEYGEGGVADLVRGVDWSEDVFPWVHRFPMLRLALRDKVRGNLDALRWARTYPEDREHMRPYITESVYGFYWAESFPEEKDLVRHLVSRDWDAVRWGETFPEDKDLMFPFVAGTTSIKRWLDLFPEHKEAAFAFVREPHTAGQWAFLYPEERHLVRHLVAPDPYWVDEWLCEFPQDAALFNREPVGSDEDHDLDHDLDGLACPC